jgi:hypothetical protein
MVVMALLFNNRLTLDGEHHCRQNKDASQPCGIPDPRCLSEI